MVILQVPVVAIEFEPEYREVFGLLKAMITANEKSQRALWISAEVGADGSTQTNVHTPLHCERSASPCCFAIDVKNHVLCVLLGL